MVESVLVAHSLHRPGPGLRRQAQVRRRAPHPGRRGSPRPGPRPAAHQEAISLAELADNEQVLAAVTEAIAEANGQLARVQQIKRWRLLPVEWTAESEELTPTFKLKRRIIHRKYADVIDSLYAEEAEEELALWPGRG